MTTTESKWAERVRDWRMSGYSATQYARGRDFAPATLVWWSSRLRSGLTGRVAVEASAEAVPSKEKVRMARVVRTPRAASGAIVVRIGGAGIEVREGFDRALLREVVEALGGTR